MPKARLAFGFLVRAPDLRAYALACAVVVVLSLGGCASQDWVKVRSAPRNPLTDPLRLLSRSGPRPSGRTQQFLRRNDLVADADGDPKALLRKVKAVVNRDPTPDNFYSFSELAYLGAVKSESQKDTHKALDLYGASVAHSYMYLFDPRLGQLRNPYDPEFRRSCDLYNIGLESALRILRKQGNFKPDVTQTVETAGQTWDITTRVKSSRWPASDVDKIEFVSDYEVSGLTNKYRSFGLGVPLIVVRKPHQRTEAGESYYPPGMSFPMTAFLRLLPDEVQAGGTTTHHRAELELYDPLISSDVVVGDRRVPLESDLSTPLAYFLNDPAFAKLDLSTTGLLHPEETQALTGLYMLEPYRPEKIPVLMIHGLWSSPMTWMEMFNDLQASPELRDRYQFWFYLYPTGQPFWYTAAQLRDSLAKVRETYDPRHNHPALDQMVLVGHSMGGLVAKLQTIESRNDVWATVSDKPFYALKANDPLRNDLMQTFFFHPNPGIKEVITIGTPHRGSDFSNNYTQWVGRKLITLPQMFVQKNQQLRTDNPGFFPHRSLLEVSTSIDSLSPKTPLFPVMLAAPHDSTVRYHNIVGRLPRDEWYRRLTGDGDGVVPYTSAHLDNVASEIVVTADHTQVHRHPRAVLEVRHILLEHVALLRNTREGQQVLYEQAISQAANASPFVLQRTAQPVPQKTVQQPIVAPLR